MNKEQYCRLLGIDENATITEILDSHIMYLRKSRKDMDFYKDEPLEVTLTRHEKILQDWFTTVLGVPLPDDDKHIIREVVSGDTIQDRPGMTHLLDVIENKKIKGVLCVEIERLARGNTIDQGIIAQTFQLTQTKIITPQKIYDLDNENDLSHFEDGLRRSRDYLVYIKRALIRGKKASVNEGKYPFSVPAYGYKRKKLENEKGYTLEFDEQEYKVVRLIIDLFLNGLKTTYSLKQTDTLEVIREIFGVTNEIIYSSNPNLILGNKKEINIIVDNMGTGRIAKYLNYLGIKPRNSKIWTAAMIKNILENRTKYGLISWEKRKAVKTLENKKIMKSRPINKNYIEIKGIFPAIATMEEKEKIENKLHNNNSRVTTTNVTSSPLVSLIKCGQCGNNMFKKKSKQKACKQQVRKYNVDKEKLIHFLREKKEQKGISINQIAFETHTTRDIIAHIFLKDYNKATVPKPELWFKIKSILDITTDEFDESITTYTEKTNNIIENSLICNHPYCKNIGSDIKLVEKEILKALTKILEDYKNFINNYGDEAIAEQKEKNYTLEIIENEIKKIHMQLDKACELVEDGTYTKQKYIERTNILNIKLKELNDRKKELLNKNDTLKKVKDRKKAIPIIQNILSNYNDVLTNEEKNKLLKTIVDTIYYNKEAKYGNFSLKFMLKY